MKTPATVMAEMAWNCSLAVIIGLVSFFYLWLGFAFLAYLILEKLDGR